VYVQANSELEMQKYLRRMLLPVAKWQFLGSVRTKMRGVLIADPHKDCPALSPRNSC